jgi:peptidoglycan/LPS O-acetylase OafA/YrhL
MPLVSDRATLGVTLRECVVRNDAEALLRPRMPELDSLRGVAVLLVLLYHGFGFSHGIERGGGLERLFVAATLYGWVGVDLFFVMSGFLITGMLLETRTYPRYYRRFYIRRCLRILPIYFTVLLVLAAVTRTPLFAHAVPWSFVGISALFLANFTPIFGISASYGVLWSLAVEEHFYLVWPILVRRFSDRSLTICAGITCVICPALRGASFLLHHAQGWTDYGAYTWLVADGLATGALLAVTLRGPLQTRQANWKLTGAALGTGLGMLIGGAPFGILSRNRLLGITFRQTALNLSFFGILLIVLLIGTGPWKRVACFKPLRLLGEISYGVYLIHTLVFWIVDRCSIILFPHVPTLTSHFPLMCARFCVAITATLIVCYISRWHFEERFLRLKNRLSA